MPKRLVVIGNGMAGMACLDQILKKKPDFDITILSEEPYYNYNRILLSSVINGDKKVEDIYINTREWYGQNRIDLRLGTRAVDVDSQRKIVTTEAGEEISYDLLLLATGSIPVIPPIQGKEKKGVFVFRNIADCEAIIEQCQVSKKAIVIGGGLLGLEAARGLLTRNMDVTVVHLAGHLMEMQLDEKGGRILKSALEQMGLKIRLNTLTTEFIGNGKVEGVLFKDGTIEETDLVVISCGIRPNIDLAKKAKLKINKGIVVNDFLETSDPSIFAVGECVEHRGKVYGLVAPLFDQGRVLADTLTGQKGSIYEGSTTATKLKVAGIEVFSAGEYRGDAPGMETIAYEDEAGGIYKKVVIQKDHLVGVVLVGESSDANRLLEKIRKGEVITSPRHALLFEGIEKAYAAEDVMSRPDSDTICGCIGVTKGQIICAIREKGLKSVSEVKSCTNASSGCGTCSGLVENILRAVAGGDFQKEKREVLCECILFSKERIRTIIQTQRLKTVQEVLEIYGNGTGCSLCKPALSFILDEVLCGEHKEDRSARFINDRVHANIQRDGTFSVVPRMRGGVTSPEELRKIADVAEKYKVRMVKVTGSQRLDLLGVKKEDLPKIWAELGMTSGFAYAKAVRMVKSCVGTDFCRYGTQDSIQTGIDLETMLEGLYTPAKVKMGVVGCPRNCAEATVKDIGLVGIEGGWQVVVGGAAGKRVREADILVTVATTEEALEAAKLFFQYYRENGEYLERTYDFVERLGMETIRRETVLAPEEVRRGMLERLAKSKARAVNPWLVESKKPVHPAQFQDFVLPKEREALIER